MELALLPPAFVPFVLLIGSRPLRRKNARPKRNIFALHIHVLVLKEHLSMLVKLILRRQPVQEYNDKAPMKCIKFIGRLLFTFQKRASQHSHTFCSLVGVAMSPWSLRYFIRGMPFLYSFIPDPSSALMIFLVFVAHLLY